MIGYISDFLTYSVIHRNFFEPENPDLGTGDNSSGAAFCLSFSKRRPIQLPGGEAHGGHHCRGHPPGFKQAEQKGKSTAVVT
jgi:hypothetical protein